MKFAVLDIETHVPQTLGFNKYYNPQKTFAYDNARPVSIAFKICYLNDNGIIESENTQDYIINRKNFVIPPSKYHNITNEVANNQGITMEEFSEIFNTQFSDVEALIAHNVSFDKNILLSELYRCSLMSSYNILNEIPTICSGEKTTRLLGLRNRGGYPKMPKLEELYKYTFNTDIQNAHQSLHDVNNLFSCIESLHNNKKLIFFKTKNLTIV